MVVNKWDPLSVTTCKYWAGIGNHRLIKEFTDTISDDEISKLSTFSKWALVWIGCTAAFKALIAKHLQIKTLKYEDLVKNPQEILTNFFKQAGIPESQIPDNIDQIPSTDSQAGTPFSSRGADKEALKKGLTPITKELKDEVLSVCK